MALTEYNRFVKKHRLAGKSMKQIGKMWSASGKKGKSKSKSKAKVEPVSRPRGKAPASKPRSRPKGVLERKMIAFRKEWDDWRRALKLSYKQSSFKYMSGTWRIRLGPHKTKRKKLSEAMRLMRKKVKGSV